ncbi:hypothetical protein NKH36_20960 [Mesorhizobium sp. M1312]|uniref:hypothetical protein n=1 Tax=unclassified Mesorhizobium TaxID=325217 RepID=UPI003336268D
MFFSHRGRFHTIVTAAFAIILVVLVLKATWDIAALNAEYSREAEQATKEYADRTQESIASTCRDRDVPAFAKCIEEIVKATEEAKTAERDLSAQRSMALWALGMLWATVASIAVTGIGIYFVWRTLDANTDAVAQAKAANDIAKQATEAQLRAYLIVKEVSAELIEGSDQADQIDLVQFTLVIKNGGATPAIKIAHDFSITENRGDNRGPRIGNRAVIMMDATRHRLQDLAPGDELTVVSQRIPYLFFESVLQHGVLNCGLACRVSYRPVVSAEEKVLDVRYWIRGEEDDTQLRISRSGPNESS